MTEDVIIKPATSEDMDAVAELEKETFSDPYSLKMLNDTMCTCSDTIYVARTSDKVAGYIIFQKAGDEGELLRVAVSSEMKRKGIGVKLVDAMLNYFFESGVTDVFLEVRETNEAAIRLYENKNFQVLATRKNYYRNPVENAIIMKRGL